MEYALKNRSNITAVGIASKGSKSGKTAPRTIIINDKGTTEICLINFLILKAQQKYSDPNSREVMPQYFQIQVQTKLSTLLSGR